MDAQLQAQRQENDHLRDDRNATADAHRQALESLRQELETARAARATEQTRAVATEAARTDLQQRLADAVRERREAVARTQELDAELTTFRNQHDKRHQDAPPRLLPAGKNSSDSSDRERVVDPADRMEQLARQLQRAEEANERLRLFLGVIGTHTLKNGNEAIPS
jgi:hypothetical protein